MSEQFDNFVTAPAPQEVPDEGSVRRPKRGTRERVKSRRLKRVSRQDVADSIRSLAMMLTVQRGELTPVVTLSQQYEGTKLGGAYGRIAELLGEGVPFAQAFAQQEIFPPVARRLVLVGADTGTPGQHLTKAADLIDESLDTSSKVRSALLEPAILGVGVLVFFIAMVTWAVPQMVEMFAATGAPLPALSKFALQLSSVLQVVIPVLAVMLFGVFVWWRRVGRHNERLRTRLDAWVLRLPVVGPLKREAALANSLSVLAALATLGISEREALLTAAKGCDNRAIGAHFVAHADELTAGRAQFSDVADGVFVPLAVGTVLSAAATSGHLDTGLEHVADSYRRTSRTKADNLSTALGPAANIIVGSLFAGAVIVIYVPMYSLFGSMTAF